MIALDVMYKKLQFQSTMSIGYLIFLFTFIVKFNKISHTEYGMTISDMMFEGNYFFTGAALWSCSIVIILLFFIFSSTIITFEVKKYPNAYKTLYDFSQLMFLLLIFCMVIMFLFVVIPNLSDFN